jgi:hypothetical protein
LNAERRKLPRCRRKSALAVVAEAAVVEDLTVIVRTTMKDLVVVIVAVPPVVVLQESTLTDSALSSRLMTMMLRMLHLSALSRRRQPSRLRLTWKRTRTTTLPSDRHPLR